MVDGFFYVEPSLVEQNELDFANCIGSKIFNGILRNDYHLFILVDRFKGFIDFIVLNKIGEVVNACQGKIDNPKLDFLQEVFFSSHFIIMTMMACGTPFGKRYYIGCEKIGLMYESQDEYFFSLTTDIDFDDFMAEAEEDGCIQEFNTRGLIDSIGESIKFYELKLESPKEERNNEIKITESKEEKEMGVIKGFEFGLVGGDRVRLSHLGVAVKNKLGEFVAYDKAKGELINVDLIDLGIDNMIYKMPVAIKEIVAGDVIFHGNVPMVIKGVREDKKLVAIDPYDAEEKVIIPIKNMFGFDFATKVVSMIDFSNLGANEKTPFGNMLPLLLMSKGDGKGMSDMLPLMMMSQGGGAFDMSNPMMMMMMLGDKKGGMSDMLPLMMMSGMNPFGAKPVEKPTE